MRRHGFIAAAVGAVLWLSAALGAGGAAGQAPATAREGQAATSTPARTPWGDPDVSGFFTNKDQQGIPFERDPAYGPRQLVTDEEFVEREDRARRQVEIDLAEFDVETADTANAGAVGSATSPPPHWLDRPKVSRRTSLVVDPPDGRLPPMTPEGARQAAARVAAPPPRRFGSGLAESYTDGSLYDRCISRGLPGSMMPAIYGNSYQIVQGPGFVAIRYEMIHETRIVPLDGRPRLGAGIRQYMGDARGRWEGNTLVVETTNFRPELTYRNASAETTRLVERFTRTAPGTVEWSVTVDDPGTWTRPWTFVMDLTEDDSQPVMEYACHEGNYAMFNTLSGARAADSSGR